MKIVRNIAWITPLCLALLSPACVELCGQRVTIRYEEANDRFFLLIHYDGIHDSGSKRNGDGRKQIPEFVKHGDVLFWDWPMHIPFEEVRKAADKKEFPASAHAFAATVIRSVKTRILGRYRDAEGRVGAAQLVVISDFKEFLRKANAAISEALIAEVTKSGPEPEWRFTLGRLLEAARRGNQWITVEGHSLKGSLPVHPAEWARGKAAFLTELLETAQKMVRLEETVPPLARKKKSELRHAVQVLSSATISFAESAGVVSWRIGDPSRPSTVRARIRDEYSPNLEDVIAKHVPNRLDEALASHLLGVSEANNPDLNAVLEWGPPEETVRALLGVVSGEDEAARHQALERLDSLGAAWNREQSVPEAPTSREDLKGYVADWKAWYRAMLAFPLESEATKTES